ncbi:uncharacterized protein LOC123877402 isoform X2 [Maniola jurtina]|uniref:uncharacterized protein LOC123877402 isoform X2 n=1 Tax=Maniola jurtina TaxID=191418 RepID=UPI001E689D00|nr:uncharacterized protein LOC123877402 isoform X2 [Maniola jurtina]
MNVMASQQPSTSGVTDSITTNTDGKLDEYGKETYELLKYVLHKMSTESDQNIVKVLPLHRAQHYTGLRLDTLQALISADVVIVDKITEINRKCVHDVLMSYYLDEHVMPTSTELFNHLQESLPPYEDIRSFRKKLVKMGYIFKEKENCFVIYEKPSIRFERFLYLKKKLQYREDKRPIYYISEIGVSYDKVWNIDESMVEKKERHLLFYFAVSSLKGVQFVRRTTHFDPVTFGSWILNELMPNLEVNSVVILDNTKHHCEKYCENPKKTSPSYIMIEWLKYHEIPFNDTMSTVELYTLIDKYTDVHARLYKVDMWLKQNGHDVLRLPNCINEMTPAAQVRHLISKKLDCKEILLTKTIEDIVSDISESELNSYNLMLADEETRLYNLEIKLDNILDNLKPSFNIEEDLYLPFLSDSD